MILHALQSEQAQPTEVIHDTRWLASLLDRTPRELHQEPILAADSGLRTFIALRKEQRESAERLVRRRYAERGYATAPGEGEHAACSVTLLAQLHGRLLGTLTVRPDNPSGLLAEASYAQEIRRLRDAGRQVGELVKLAVAEEADWRTALDALVQSAYLVTRMVHGLSDVLIEINPRHARFYRRVFGFIEAGGKRWCDRVNAPSVLMRLDLAAFGERVRLALS